MTKQPFRSSNFDPRPVVNLQESILKMGPVMNSIMADEVLNPGIAAATGATVKDMVNKNFGVLPALNGMPNFAQQLVEQNQANANNMIAALQKNYEISWSVTNSQQLANLRRAISGISKIEAFDTSAITSAVTSINKISQTGSKNLAGIQEALQRIDWDGIETAVNRTIETASQLNVQDVSEFVDIVREQPEMVAVADAAQDDPQAIEQLLSYFRGLVGTLLLAGADHAASGVYIIGVTIAGFITGGLAGGSVSFAASIAPGVFKLQDKMGEKGREFLQSDPPQLP